MLDPQEYAPGRRVRLSGQELHVRGSIADSAFNQWLVVSEPDSHVAVLILAPAVAEEAEAIDPDAHPGAVSGVPDATVPQGPAATGPTSDASTPFTGRYTPQAEQRGEGEQ